jgi:hypothetical protein
VAAEADVDVAHAGALVADAPQHRVVHACMKNAVEYLLREHLPRARHSMSLAPALLSCVASVTDSVDRRATSLELQLHSLGSATPSAHRTLQRWQQRTGTAAQTKHLQSRREHVQKLAPQRWLQALRNARHKVRLLRGRVLAAATVVCVHDMPAAGRAAQRRRGGGYRRRSAAGTAALAGGERRRDAQRRERGLTCAHLAHQCSASRDSAQLEVAAGRCLGQAISRSRAPGSGAEAVGAEVRVRGNAGVLGRGGDVREPGERVLQRDDRRGGLVRRVRVADLQDFNANVQFILPQADCMHAAIGRGVCVLQI